MKAQRSRYWILLALLCVPAHWLAAMPLPAEAHWADQSAVEIRVKGATARMTLTLPTGLVGFADDTHAGRLSDDEIRAHREDLQRFLSSHVRLSARLRTPGGEIREGRLAVLPAPDTLPASGPAGLAPATHTTLGLVFSWAAPVDRLMIRYDLFLPGVSTASCLATILADGRVHTVAFTPGHEEATIALGAPAVWQAAGGFVVMGVEHILTGYDHMLFLLSLLAVGAALPQLLKIVTAFTVAHSVTLSLGVLGIVDLPSRWVESAIALSITYVAAENIWRGAASLGSRWLVTFGFGLVHGLGFASALTELHLPRVNLAASLVGFNLGVEVGQVSVILLATLALDAVRQSGWGPRVGLGLSTVAAVTGFVWFLQRALGA